ncbi:glycosyltransferase family 4 protein [Polynucleobacter paneuropaeus]|nr:glycosyltransferase family 4 protein [Polynucleobacter paneuropaeus]
MKNIALVADAYPPLHSSAAVQLWDLSLEFSNQGYRLTVLLPDAQLTKSWTIEMIEGIQICRLKSLPTKNMGYVRRTFNEFLGPFLIRHHYYRSPLAHQRWDGIVWYSPTIFFGPFINCLKKKSNCRSYLILRDIFPQWAVDLGLLKKRLPYLFLKWIEMYQYGIADVIGVQSQANLPYFEKMVSKQDQRIEVLHNWLGPSENIGCDINLASTTLANRKILVYAGNMGAAQATMVFLDLAQSLNNRKDIGLVLVGRGSDFQLLKQEASCRGLTNTLFFDEIPSAQIPGLYAQCHIGLVALDGRHKTHNIPGKFLSYMQAGLPVLAKVNPGNDLLGIVAGFQVGYVTDENSIVRLKMLAESLLDDLDRVGLMSFESNCQKLMNQLFLPDGAVKQILAGLDN